MGPGGQIRGGIGGCKKGLSRGAGGQIGGSNRGG